MCQICEVKIRSPLFIFAIFCAKKSLYKISIFCIRRVRYVRYVEYLACLLMEDTVFLQTFSDRTLGVMSWIMPLFVAASTFGGLNGAIFTSAR